MVRPLLALLAFTLASSAALADAPGEKPLRVPTWWAITVTREEAGTPTFKSSTPETLGGTVGNTGAWNCAYAPTERGANTERATGWEKMDLTCSLGDAEAFTSVRCDYRTKAIAGRAAAKQWKRGEWSTLNLRRKGDATSVVTVSLRCDVDAAFVAN